MEIIKMGTLPHEKIYEATCQNCFCVFRFMRNEAENCFDMSNNLYLKIKCPTVGCYHKIYVSME